MNDGCCETVKPFPFRCLGGLGCLLTSALPRKTRSIAGSTCLVSCQPKPTRRNRECKLAETHHAALVPGWPGNTSRHQLLETESPKILGSDTAPEPPMDISSGVSGRPPSPAFPIRSHRRDPGHARWSETTAPGASRSHNSGVSREPCPRIQESPKLCEGS